MAMATSACQLSGAPSVEPSARLELNGPVPDLEANTTQGPIKFPNGRMAAG